MLSALKVKYFQLDFTIFFAHFFANGDNATTSKETSKFRQEKLNILSALKFAGSQLAFSEWKVRFSLISPRIFSLGYPEEKFSYLLYFQNVQRKTHLKIVLLKVWPFQDFYFLKKQNINLNFH
jgi:hypothetical protein